MIQKGGTRQRCSCEILRFTATAEQSKDKEMSTSSQRTGADNNVQGDIPGAIVRRKGIRRRGRTFCRPPTRSVPRLCVLTVEKDTRPLEHKVCLKPHADGQVKLVDAPVHAEQASKGGCLY